MREQTPRREGSTKQSGFSLIELLIVVSVILIIAAIAIPNFIRSKMRANESSAVQNLRSITTANTVYSITYSMGFSTALAKLGGSGPTVDSTAAGLLDSVLSAGNKSGYSYTYSAELDGNGKAIGYSVTAEPNTPGSTGDRYFYTDQRCIIRQNTTGTAGPSDPPI